MKSISADLCAQLGPQVILKNVVGTHNDSKILQALAICESFGITDTMLSAPIGNISQAISKTLSFIHCVSALDWVGYNSYDNQGELMTEKEWDENVRNA